MVKGQYATVGFVARLHEPVVADHNSYAIDVLLNNGAVLYIKTNIPQTMQVYSKLERFSNPASSC